MRKYLRVCMLVGILCLCAHCAALADMPGPAPIPTRDGYMLIGADGTALTDIDAYVYIEDLGAYGPTHYFAAYESGDECVLLDQTGAKLTETVFEEVRRENDTLRVIIDSLSGVWDMQLNEIIPCAYTQLVYNGIDGYLALNTNLYDDSADGVYYVDMQAQEHATGVKVFFGLGQFSQQLMSVMSGDNMRMGYLNTRGEWAITPQYDYAGEFSGGISEAGISTGMGVIDQSGNWLLTPKYYNVSCGQENAHTLLAQENTRSVVVIDPHTFEVVKEFEGEELYFAADNDTDNAVLYCDDCTLLIDNQGNVLLSRDVSATFDEWAAMNGCVIVWDVDESEDEKAALYHIATGERLSDTYEELDLLGVHEGQPIYRACMYDEREEVDTEAEGFMLDEIEDTRSYVLLDADGKPLTQPCSCDSVVYLENGFVAYLSESQVQVRDLRDATLCTFAFE